MGLLRDVLTAFRPENVRRGLAAARTPPSQAEIDAAVAALPPEQRAAYEANMAAVERGRAEAQASWEAARQAEREHRVLDGPAGRYVHGASLDEAGSPAALEARIAERGVLGAAGELREQRRGELRQGVRQVLGRHEVAQVEDPAERERVAREERALRDEARAPYRAPGAVPVTIARLATRGDTQLAELLAHLRSSGLAARPDAVFGAYRVPDRISGPLTPHSERGRVVEWDVVHEAGAADASAGPAADVVATAFEAGEQWVARRVGEPSVLDEDLALAFCLDAGVGPERCLGLARVCELRTVHSGGDGEHDPLRTLVRGVVALHPPGPSGARERLRTAAPLALPTAPPGGIHVEVLDWETVGRAVHPRIHDPPPVPSPFPYLPATPQELLRAHLEVVGLRAADCYSAQATVDRPRELTQGGLLQKNWGPRQPCADGKPRMRTHGCEVLVLVYRDRPGYAEGRERWAAYEREVLQARLARAVRPPVHAGDGLDGLPAPLRAAERVADWIDGLGEWGAEAIPPFRYCWPPAGA
jgi:hypothetical protein